MTRLALILTAVVACSSVCSVVAQGGSGGRLQRSTCPSGEIKVQRKDVSREFKEKYMQYNRRAYENKGVHNLPMPESNGCSTMGIKVGGEEDFTSCCDLHDVCYQTCGLTQQKCDKLFEKCMKHLCVESFPENKQCVQAAQMYTMGVSMFGGGGFMESQELYCECAKENDLQQHYEDLFINFYKSFTELDEGQIREKVSTIIPSTDDGGSKLTNKDTHKLFRTFYKLMKKYPHSIHHVLSRVGKKPPPIPPKRKKGNAKKSEL